MEGEQFANGYPQQLRETDVYTSSLPPTLQKAEEWSYKFGHLLHNLLRGNDPDTLANSRDVDKYRSWLHNYRQLEVDTLSRLHTDPHYRKALDFHAINRHLLDLWTPLKRGHWGAEEKRLQRLSMAQSAMALEGIYCYLARQQYIEQLGGEYVWFLPEYEGLRRQWSGIAQEYDSTIVLLEFARQHPNLTVLPAPMQFEQAPHNKRRNVDLVVVDVTTKRAVGVQVKSGVHQKLAEAIDPQRVVLIDGKIDLGNVKVVRIKKASANQAVKPWPGIIAAKKVDSLPSKGRGLTRAGMNPAHLQNLKDEAQRLVGDMRVDYQDLANKIGARILAKL